MGGGGAMRAAAKVGAGGISAVAGGYGIVSGGLRPGVASASFHPETDSRPVSPIKRSSSSPEAAATSVRDAQKLGWEVDDWEFAGGEEEHRTVFGSTPTKQETKEATSELKDALEQVYLTSGNSSGLIPTMVSRVPGLSVLSSSEHSETKPSQTIIAASAPEHALQAFKLLTESTAVQTVVASIACDQNVWDAVLGNCALVEFLESQKSSTRFEEMDKESSIADSDSQYQYQDTPMTFADIPDLSLLAERAGTGFTNAVQSVKLVVLEMVSSASDVLQNIFGASIADDKEGDDEHSKLSPMEKKVGASLMALAMMVIMVVLVKRS